MVFVAVVLTRKCMYSTKKKYIPQVGAKIIFCTVQWSLSLLQWAHILDSVLYTLYNGLSSCRLIFIVPTKITSPQKSRSPQKSLLWVRRASTAEQLIVHQLVSELNALHCMKLSEKPELKCGVCLPTREHGLSRLILVGPSHVGKLANLLGPSDQVLYLALLAQTLSKASVDGIAEKLSSLNLPNRTLLSLTSFPAQY